ncbi:hypothetical protein [Pseudomonas putida]|uniref:Uncharacterized protein n=1 Tax=Pseudomonas putida (strain W619) TaxID=390235 RepID=B1JD15_PSEPW|nr:hypothetical protein [Pseudomonas putida]QQE82906.1 hypothetical protein JET17_20115 [Pseudomonas putida]
MSAPIAQAPLAREGQLLQPAMLDAQAMAYMNFARLEHRKLEALVRTIVIPMLGGYHNELAKELDRHLEQARTFSGNFCWQHRHLGASYGLVGEGADV